MAQIKSEMAGTLLEFTVKVGDNVSAGQQVATLESMKMEIPVESSLSGKVTRLIKNHGDFVNEGEALLELS